MKKLISIITVLLLIWGILMFVDYMKGYVNEEKFLLTIDLEVTEEYTKRSGLGYYVKLYNYDDKKVTNGQILKEFAIFNFVVSKQVAVVNNG